jgi:hypothetical protein
MSATKAAYDPACTPLEACMEDPTNEPKMRAALEGIECSTIFLTEDSYTKPWNLLHIKLCKEMNKPIILVCWKDSPLRNDLLNGLRVVACIQLEPDEKSRDPHVACLIRQTWAAFKGREHKV